MSLIITEYGMNALANSVTHSTNINLKYIGIGDANIEGLDDGNVEVPTFTQLSTDLINRRYFSTISEYTTVVNVEDGTNTISMSMIIPYTSGGYTIREIAVYMDKNNDIDDQAFAIGSLNGIYRPSEEESGSRINLTVKCNLKISSNANITISTSSESDILQQKISNIVDRKLDEYFEDHTLYTVPKDGNFGNILLKSGNEPEDYTWLRPGMMVSGIIRSDENDNKFIN